MKNPDRRQAESGLVGQQLYLFDPPPFDPIFPNPSSLSGRAITLLLTRPSLTSPDFQTETKSWRLAAYVNVLKGDGWPIESIEIAFVDDRSRTIAKYGLPDWVKRGIERLQSTASDNRAS